MRRSYSPAYTCRKRRNSMNEKELLTCIHMQKEKEQHEREGVTHLHTHAEREGTA